MNYYSILEITESATSDEIKAAFRRLSKIHHPDAGGDPEAFRNLSQAYETLSDPDQRASYDEFGDLKSLEPFEQEILSHFSIVMEVYLNGHGKLHDVKSAIKLRLTSKLESIRSQINGMRLQMEKMEGALKIVSAKQKAKNIFKLTLIQAQKKLNTNLESAITNESIVSKAIDQIDLYEFNVEGAKVLHHFHVS